MKRTLLVLVLVLVTANAAAEAQSLVLPPGPATPGSTITATLLPGPAGQVCVSGTSLFMLTPEGDLVTPQFTQGQILILCTGTLPGLTASLQIPPSGPGSSGSFVAYVRHAPGIVARLDVGAPSASFPALHTFPEYIHAGFISHQTPTTWYFVNTSPSPVTFGPGDVIQVFPPGGVVPVLVLPLAGLTVPAGMRLSVPFPLAATGPFTVDVAWLDPAGGPVRRRIGITTGPYGDLHLRAGHSVPLGGAFPVDLRFLTLGGPLPTYALLAGTLPGSTALNASVTVPLSAADPLVLASLGGALFPLMTNSPGTLSAVPGPGCAGYCGPASTGYYGATVTLYHPGPGLSGLVVRLAGVAVRSTTGEWLATQPEEILFL
jgi:hypothetical protein